MSQIVSLLYLGDPKLLKRKGTGIKKSIVLESRTSLLYLGDPRNNIVQEVIHQDLLYQTHPTDIAQEGDTGAHHQEERNRKEYLKGMYIIRLNTSPLHLGDPLNTTLEISNIVLLDGIVLTRGTELTCLDTITMREVCHQPLHLENMRTLWIVITTIITETTGDILPCNQISLISPRPFANQLPCGGSVKSLISLFTSGPILKTMKTMEFEHLLSTSSVNSYHWSNL